MSCQVHIIERSKQLAEIALDNPSTGNALSDQLLTDLIAALRYARDATPVVVALRSTGKVFCSGFDLSEPVSDSDALHRFALIGGLLEQIADAPFVTVALVDGPAFGAGADLVAACDYRVGTDRARFRFPGPRFSMVLGLQRLAAITDRETARDVALRGSVLNADQAVACGLLSQLATPESCGAFIDELVQQAGELDAETRRAILAVGRDTPKSDSSALLAAATRAGLGERINAFAARVRADRS